MRTFTAIAAALFGFEAVANAEQKLTIPKNVLEQYLNASSDAATENNEHFIHDFE